MERCDQCGFVYDEADAPAAGAALRSSVGALAELLTATDPTALRARPSPRTWSALEYGCHVRDVLLVQRERVLQARRQTSPSTVPMGRDERAEHDGYAEQSPVDVARQLVDAAALFAGVLERLDPDGWDRTLVYGYPEPATRSLRWVAVHTVHEARHHLADARASLP